MSTDAHLPTSSIEHLLTHRSWLRALARSLVADEARADEVVQDTWLAALRRPPREPGAGRAWLRTVAKNVVRDRHRVDSRRRVRELSAARPDATADTTEVVERAELQRELTRHVLALAEPYRTTILLRFFEELPPRDVAARMDVPVETVRTRVRRGLDRLRAALEEEHGTAGDWRVALAPLLVLPGGGVATTAGTTAGTTAKLAAALGAVAALNPVAWLVACAVLAAVAVALVLTGDPPTPDSTANAPPAVVPAPAPADADENPPPPTPTDGDSEPVPDAGPAGEAVPKRTASVVAVPPALPSAGLPATLVRFPATDAQPIGMDEDEIKTFLTEDLGRDLSTKEWEKFPFLWEYGFLFMTPRHTRRVSEFEIAPFETTNAQWKLFLDSPVNLDEDETPPGMTLKTLVEAVYGIDADDNPVDAQSAGLYLYYRNEGRLMGALNPDADPKWEPLKAWVDDAVIPAGTRIEFTRMQPPPYWPRGEVPEDELVRPVRYVSWNDARRFCRWAGLHLPREVEWERAARGDAGRRFPWGDEWDPSRCVWRHFRGPDRASAGPEVVDSLPEGATPEGVHHMLGNISELVFDFARRYPGSEADFLFENNGLLARGGMWDDEDYVMLAADRIWDLGTAQITPRSRADGFGFRYALYPQPGRDLALELATYADEHFRVGGAATWLPYPVGMSERDREKRGKRQPLQGFSLDRIAGWMSRQIDTDAAHHAVVSGPARGIAFLPIKGLLGSFLKDKGRFEKLSLDEEEVALVGAILTTPNCSLALVDEAGEPVTLDMSDEWGPTYASHDLDFRYHVGAWLVLEGDRIAVYAGDASDVGVFGAHLKGAPLGYLPEPYTETWAITAETPPTGAYADGVATLGAPIPQLERDGTVKRGGKAVLLTIKVPATFE